MHGDHHDVLLLADPHEAGAKEGAPRQVKGLRGLLRDQAGKLGLASRLRQGTEVVGGQIDRKRVGNDLEREAPSRGECGPRCLVAADDLIQGPTQGPVVERTDQPRDGRGDVVRFVARLQLVEKPEPLLGERRGDRRAKRSAFSIGGTTRAGAGRQLAGDPGGRGLGRSPRRGTHARKPRHRTCRAPWRGAGWRRASDRRGRRNCRESPPDPSRAPSAQSPAEGFLDRAAGGGLRIVPRRAVRTSRWGRAGRCDRPCDSR